MPSMIGLREWIARTLNDPNNLGANLLTVGGPVKGRVTRVLSAASKCVAAIKAQELGQPVYLVWNSFIPEIHIAGDGVTYSTFARILDLEQYVKVTGTGPEAMKDIFRLK